MEGKNRQDHKARATGEPGAFTSDTCWQKPEAKLQPRPGHPLAHNMLEMSVSNYHATAVGGFKPWLRLVLLWETPIAQLQRNISFVSPWETKASACFKDAEEIKPKVYLGVFCEFLQEPTKGLGTTW